MSSVYWVMVTLWVLITSIHYKAQKIHVEREIPQNLLLQLSYLYIKCDLPVEIYTHVVTLICTRTIKLIISVCAAVWMWTKCQYLTCVPLWKDLKTITNTRISEISSTNEFDRRAEPRRRNKCVWGGKRYEFSHIHWQWQLRTYWTRNPLLTTTIPASPSPPSHSQRHLNRRGRRVRRARRVREVRWVHISKVFHDLVISRGGFCPFGCDQWWLQMVLLQMWFKETIEMLQAAATVMKRKRVSAIFILVVLYLVMGAVVFKFLEQPHER